MRQRIAVLAMFLVCAAYVVPAAASNGKKEQLNFAFTMVKAGLWREARFRFLRANEIAPSNAGVLNNIAVMCEAIGDYRTAAEYYAKARAISPTHSTIAHNEDAFQLFYKRAFPEISLQNRSAPNLSEETARAAVPDPAFRWKRKILKFGLPTQAGVLRGGNETVVIAPFITSGEGMPQELPKYFGVLLERKHITKERARVAVVAYGEEPFDALVRNEEVWRAIAAEYRAQIVISAVIDLRVYNETGYKTEPYVSPFDGKTHERQTLIEAPGFEVDAFFFAFDATGRVRYTQREKAFYPFDSSAAQEEQIQKGVRGTLEKFIAAFRPEFKEAVRYLLAP